MKKILILPKRIVNQDLSDGAFTRRFHKVGQRGMIKSTVASIGAMKNIENLLKLIDEASATGYPATIPSKAVPMVRIRTQSLLDRRKIPMVTIPNPIAAIQLTRCNPLKTACRVTIGSGMGG